MQPLRRALLGLALAIALPLPALTGETITVASTTSIEASGLFGHILPLFTADTGLTVQVVAQGTGQALETGRRGDADVVFVHAKSDEVAFVAAGFGVERFDVMHNDFVIVGPAADPAGVRIAPDAAAALAAIAAAAAAFVSRGDDSGTHKAERKLWKAAGVAPAGKWYRETGSGMGPTLNTAAQMGAYVLADRGSWLGFGNKADLGVLSQGDPALFNPYGVILVNPLRHPHVKAAAGQAFIDWLLSDRGQAAIDGFAIGGEQAFFGSAKRLE